MEFRILEQVYRRRRFVRSESHPCGRLHGARERPFQAHAELRQRGDALGARIIEMLGRRDAEGGGVCQNAPLVDADVLLVEDLANRVRLDRHRPLLSPRGKTTAAPAPIVWRAAEQRDRDGAGP